MTTHRHKLALAAASWIVACSDPGGAGSPLAHVPTGAIRVEELSTASHALTVREVTSALAVAEGQVSAFVADSAIELASGGAEVGVVLGVDNFDPSMPAECHPAAVVQDSACPDRAQFPYVLLDAAPVQEIYLNGSVCQAVPGASAAEIVIDDEARLLRLRAVGPAFCGDVLRTFEITLVRVIESEGQQQ